MCHSYYVVRRHFLYDINRMVINGIRIILWARKEVFPTLLGNGAT